MTESTHAIVAYGIHHRSEYYVFRDNHDLHRTFVDNVNRRRALDGLMVQVERILGKIVAVTCCFNFLTLVLERWQSRVPGLDRHDTALPQRRSGIDDEEQKLPARERSDETIQARYFRQIEAIKQFSNIVRLRSWEGASWFEGPHLLYRIQRPDSHTFYDKDVGFCCPKWLRKWNYDEPSRQDLHHHVKGDQTIDNGAFETPYISMTGCPWRALNLVRQEEMSSSDVFVIYAERLWATNIQFERTTTIADRYGITYRGGFDRAPYITYTHWVAQYWIPADCIIMRMPFLKFQAVCNGKEIHRGYSTRLSGEDSLSIDDFNEASIRERS